MTERQIRIRLFLTCWIVFVLHFATDFVREHYLVLSLAENFSFRLDPYKGLHPDIFETPGRGFHHAGNPGASMIAAIPYYIFQPFIKIVLQRFKPQSSRNEVYNDPIAARADFYKQVKARGLDIKFGLVGLITMVFCMAPLSALSAVVMFDVLQRLSLSTVTSLQMSLVYAFGTPIFFRTGYLNHNLMVGIFGFIAFALLWQSDLKKSGHRFVLAGFLAGLAFLCDYSGLIIVMLLGIYAAVKFGVKNRVLFRYAWGAAIPVLLLWFYQWRSFGNPFYPPQHYMPVINRYVQLGYHGIRWDNELLWMLLFDPRVGLFVACPLLLLSFVAPVLNYFGKNLLPLRETIFILVLFLGFMIFFGFVQYTRLQWITGIRYLVPVIPFLFLLTVSVLMHLPTLVRYILMILSVIQGWCMAMVRSDEGVSVFDSIKTVFTKGPQLPWMDTLSRMSLKYAPFLSYTPPIFFYVMLLASVLAIWYVKRPAKRLGW